MSADSPVFDELATLRSLIARAQEAVGAGTFATLAPALDELASHRWRDEEHRIVYHSLRAVLRNAAIPLRHQMAAEATRMGHPDVDWALYFQPLSP
jgi:hypothetical protein